MLTVKCVRSCNTLNDLSNKVSAPNKTEDLNLRAFKMITAINESKVLTKHVTCKSKGRFNAKNVIQINGRIKLNVNMSKK